MSPAQSTVEIDGDAFKRAGQRVTAYRVKHTVRRHGRRYAMSQEELARRANVSAGCLAAFENGARRTTRAKIERIAAACEMSVDELLGPEPSTAALVLASSERRLDLVLTDEAFSIGRIFMIAHTDVRRNIVAVLHTHLAKRTDPVARALVAELCATAVWPLPFLECECDRNRQRGKMAAMWRVQDPAAIWKESIGWQFGELAEQFPEVAREMLDALRTLLASSSATDATPPSRINPDTRRIGRRTEEIAPLPGEE